MYRPTNQQVKLQIHHQPPNQPHIQQNLQHPMFPVSWPSNPMDSYWAKDCKAGLLLEREEKLTWRMEMSRPVLFMTSPMEQASLNWAMVVGFMSATRKFDVGAAAESLQSILTAKDKSRITGIYWLDRRITVVEERLPGKLGVSKSNSFFLALSDLLKIYKTDCPSLLSVPSSYLWRILSWYNVSSGPPWETCP